MLVADGDHCPFVDFQRSDKPAATAFAYVVGPAGPATHVDSATSPVGALAPVTEVVPLAADGAASLTTTFRVVGGAILIGFATMVVAVANDRLTRGVGGGFLTPDCLDRLSSLDSLRSKECFLSLGLSSLSSLGDETDLSSLQSEATIQLIGLGAMIRGCESLRVTFTIFAAAIRPFKSVFRSLGF